MVVADRDAAPLQVFHSLGRGQPQGLLGKRGGGGVKCWGWNDLGQLGNGTTTDKVIR